METSSKYEEGSKFALLGQKAATHYKDENMRSKYEQLLDRLKEHLAKQEHRRQKEIKKYVKGEIGVVRNLDSINLSRGRMTIEEKEKMKSFLDMTITKNSSSRENVRSRSFYNQRSSIYRPYALPTSHRRNFKSASHNVLNNNNNNNKGDKIKEITTKSFSPSQQALIDPNKLGKTVLSPYGVLQTKAKACSLFSDSSIDKRIK